MSLPDDRSRGAGGSGFFFIARMRRSWSFSGWLRIVRRRPHPATWVGAVAIVVGLAAAVFLGVTGKGFEILHGTVASVG